MVWNFSVWSDNLLIKPLRKLEEILQGRADGDIREDVPLPKQMMRLNL